MIRKNPAYGYRRLKSALKKESIIVNHKLLLKLLKEFGLSLPRKVKKKRSSGIEKILTDLGGKTNLVKTIPKEKRKPFMILYTDFSEIKFKTGKAYLITYLDDNCKKAIGYTLGKSGNTKLALKSFKKTERYLHSKGIDLEGIIIHQDQGKPFVSYDYLSKLLSKGITLSYSRKGTPGDNPGMESFFGRLKDEWLDVFQDADSFEELEVLIKKAIGYYNRIRIHSELDGLSPDQFLRIYFS